MLITDPRLTPVGYAYPPRRGLEVALNRKLGIAFEEPLVEFWRLTVFPKVCEKPDAIIERPSVLAFAAFERTRDAYEGGFDCFARSANY